MRFKLMTPERAVIEEDNIDELQAVAVDGSLGILKDHVPMVTPLGVDVLRYKKGGQLYPVAVMGGLLSTDGKTITVLSETAELADEVDFVRAESARKRAEARLAEHTAETDFKRAEYALAKSLARLKLQK